MAFPTNPVDGQFYNENGKTWLYTSPPGVWSIAGGTPITVDEQDPVFTSSPAASYTEAPSDGTPYARQDGGWVSATGSEVNDLTSSVTWANIPDANVPVTAVTQHQAALTITESQISDLTHTTPYTDGDVDTHLNTSTATASQVLSWTGADYDWVDVAGGAIALDDITDVDLTTTAPVADQVLGFDGTNWVAVDQSGGGEIIGTSKVELYGSGAGNSDLTPADYTANNQSTQLIAESASNRSGTVVVFDTVMDVGVGAGDTAVWWSLGSAFRIMHYGGFPDWTVEHQGVRTQTGITRQTGPSDGLVRIAIHVAADNTISYIIDNNVVQTETASQSLTQDISIAFYAAGGTTTTQIYKRSAATVGDALALLSDSGGSAIIAEIEATGDTADSQVEIKSYASGTLTTQAIFNELGLLLPTLPTADPVVAGQLWNDAGTLKVSAG